MSSDSIDEDLRKAFEAAWREGRPEPIDRFLPPEDTASYLPTLEELVHIELEFTWKAWQRVRHDADTIAPADVPTHPTSGPTRVEQYLERFPRLDQPEIVVRLIEQEQLVRIRWGDPPAADEYHRRFPDLWPREGFPATLDARSSDHATPRGASAETARPADERFAPPELPRTFGNYDLLEEIGHGGMGVVYRARQRGADRIVALKVVRRDYLQSLERDSQASALERFHHEIQAAARLAHEHIVPVYEVGDVDGNPFFSMRYVPGSSLADILRSGPVTDRQGATYMGQVARAIDEAHRHEILHRDLKPQNILIDARSDRALVADFGLAKLLTTNEELTQAGEYLGSPPYMSPEQARDASTVTTHTDVYALGATLYHVLCGRPPFQSAMPLVTMHQVIHDDPVSPRQLNPDIDRDLETICLKCLEKDPARRYASAAALADELDRYLRGEPILARPISPVGRGVRWCRRNPSMAGLIAASVALLLVALAATSAGFFIKAAALKTEAEARQTAEAATRKAQQAQKIAEQAQQTAEVALRQKAEALEKEAFSERLARNTINDFYTNMSEEALRNREGMQPRRRQLLEKARGYYETFLRMRANDPDLKDELALMHFRVGRLTHLIESPDRALPEYEKALAMQRQLAETQPENDGVQDALGDTYNALGSAYIELRRWQPASEALAHAADIRKSLAAKHPEQIELQRKLASIYMNLGVVAKETDDLETARDHFQQATRLRRDILETDPENTDNLRDLAMGHYNLANLELRLATPDLDAAEAHLTESIGRFEEVLDAAPGDLENQYLLSLAYRRLGDVQWMAENLDAAGATYQQAIGIISRLARNNPDVPKYRSAEARLRQNMGQFLAQIGNRETATDSLNAALALFQELVKQHPEVPDYERDLAGTYRELAILQVEARQEEAAVENLTHARTHLRRLVEKYPDSVDFAKLLEEVDLDLAALKKPST